MLCLDGGSEGTKQMEKGVVLVVCEGNMEKLGNIVYSPIVKSLV